MKYINKKTGVVIDVDSKISGGDWEPVQAPKTSVKKEEPTEKAPKKKITGKKKVD